MIDQVKEKLVKEIISDKKKCRINIVQKPTGYFELHKYVERYDDEEEVYYEIREMPNPQGIFDNLDVATEEAERILS